MPVKGKIVLLTVCLLVVLASTCIAGEFPIIEDSSVIGRTCGYPSGTPEDGMTATGNLDLVVENAVYAKNLELTGVGIDGETFIGFITPLRFRYRVHEQLTFETGVSLRYEFGDERDIDEVEPLLRLAYEPAEDVFIFAGTLISAHTIHDALYNDIQVFEETAQQGFQVRVDRRNFKQDLWIDWRIKETPERAERFDVASVSMFRLGSLALDAQLFIRHTGGQKNSEFHEEKSNFAYLFGGSYGFVQGRGIVEEVRAGLYYIGDYDEMHSSSGLDDTSGNGLEGVITCDMIPKENLLLHVFGSYFTGDDLYARAGDPLYSEDEYAQLGTNLVFNLPKGARIEFGVTGQYFNDSIVHTEQVYFVWGKSFTLARGI